MFLWNTFFFFFWNKFSFDHIGASVEFCFHICACTGVRPTYKLNWRERWAGLRWRWSAGPPLRCSPLWNSCRNTLVPWGLWCSSWVVSLNLSPWWEGGSLLCSDFGEGSPGRVCLWRQGVPSWERVRPLQMKEWKHTRQALRFVYKPGKVSISIH